MLSRYSVKHVPTDESLEDFSNLKDWETDQVNSLTGSGMFNIVQFSSSSIQTKLNQFMKVFKITSKCGRNRTGHP